jgi:5-methylcytosine-specific restriction enzyme subunit McrC
VLSPLEVTFDEWTLDTDENRRIRAASQRLLDLSEVPQRARVGLMRLDRLLSEVWVAPRGAPLTAWTPTRLNTRLHRLLHLADMVIAHTSVEHAAGSTRTHGFVINLAWLFEKLVARLLWEGYSELVAQKTFDLDGPGGLLSIQPDLVFNDHDGDPIAVADTKYKLLGDNGKISNDDAYQLVTYCGRLGLSTGHLIYAAGEPRPEPFDITGTQVRLVIHRIDLQQDEDNIESQVASALDKILQPEHA